MTVDGKVTEEVRRVLLLKTSPKRPVVTTHHLVAVVGAAFPGRDRAISEAVRYIESSGAIVRVERGAERFVRVRDCALLLAQQRAARRRRAGRIRHAPRRPS